MKRLSAVLADIGGEPAFWCPGCRQAHRIAVHAPAANGARWTFDGDVDSPTFAPSVHSLVKRGEWQGATWVDTGPPKTLCHLLLRKGVIQFLDDSAHELKGQFVLLPPFPFDEPA